MQYAVVIEREGDSFTAYVPGLLGCLAVGESEEEVRQLIREAIAFHLNGLREDGVAISLPSAHVEYIEIANAA